MNERSERLFREFITAFQAGDIDSLRAMVDPDIVDHTLPPGGTPGIEGLLYAVNAYREGFPDLRITVDKVVSDGDCVVGYGLISGTNTGSFFGMPPSGKSAACLFDARSSPRCRPGSRHRPRLRRSARRNDLRRQRLRRLPVHRQPAGAFESSPGDLRPSPCQGMRCSPRSARG
jgi:predicted ester cyclase